MRYEWDEAKSDSNVEMGRLPFKAVEEFEWDEALVERRDRGGETRWTAIGYIGDRLQYLVYTSRGDRRRVISLRPASRKEREIYAST